MSASGRSWTDPLTNTTVFAEVTLEDHLVPLLEWDVAPAELAPAFLHEATHHWCFDSPVGTALTLLHLQSRSATLRCARGERKTQLEHTIAWSINGYETAMEFLRPLAEGLALFAEFDIVTRADSEVFSTPLEQAAWFFGGNRVSSRELAPAALVEAMTMRVLQPMRLSSSLLKRKVSLLGQPFTCTGDAYLPGYLLVKALWRAAVRRVGRFASEPDLFLTYLRSYLYDDLGMVGELLDTAKDEIRVAEAVANRLIRRLREFPAVTEGDVAAFERALVAADDVSRFMAIRLDPQEIAVGDRRLGAAKRWLDQRGSPEVGSAHARYDRLLARRELMYLGSWPAEVEVTGSVFRVHGQHGVVREGPVVQGTDPGRGSGFIDIAYWQSRRSRACIITREGQTIATQSFAPLQRDNEPELLDVAGQRDEARAFLGALDEAVDTHIDGSWVGVARTHMRDFRARILDQALLPPALPRVPDDLLDDTLRALRVRGFYPLLDRDRALIEGFALLGLATSVLPPSRTLLRVLFQQRGLDLDRTIEAANDLERRHGTGRVLVSGDVLVPDV